MGEIDKEWEKANPPVKKMVEINIAKESSFIEIWYEGFVKFDGKEHRFWLVLPKTDDDKGEPYEIDVRWFFQRVPREVRAMAPNIIENFKQLHEL